MSKPSKKAPELRFKGFSDAWEQRKLGEVVKLFGGNAFKGSDSTDSGIRWLKIANVGINGIDWTTLSYLPNNFWIENESFQLFKEDYVMALTRPILNNTLKIVKMDTSALLNQRVAKISFTTYAEFGYQLLKKKGTVDLIQNELAGTDPPNLSSKDLDNVNVNITINIEEQIIIGEFFKQLDNLITLHQRKLDALKRLKEAYLQNMFPTSRESVLKLRFADFEEDWEQRKLGNVADIIGGGTPSTSNEEYWNGEIDWYSPVEIGNKIYVDGSQKKITLLGLKKSSARILPIGTVLFTSRAGIGNTAILAKEGATNQGFQSIVPHENQLDSYFIYSRTHELKRYGETNGAGSTFVEVSGKQMAKMLILIPRLEEQKQIGAFFKELDNLITLHQHKLEQFQQVKQAYLQKMFI